MRRLFWLVAGVTVGVLAFRKFQQTAEKFTATSVGSSLGAALTQLAESAADFLADVRASMSEQEAALRAGVGFDSDTRTGDIPAGDAPAAQTPVADTPPGNAAPAGRQAGPSA